MFWILLLTLSISSDTLSLSVTNMDITDQQETLSYLDESTLKEHQAKRALIDCNHNTACALSLLHKQNLQLHGNCWICHALATKWQAKPLTSDVVLQTHEKESLHNNEQRNCSIPQGMKMLLMAGRQIRNNMPPFWRADITCKETQSTPSNMMVEVPLQYAETCVCSRSSQGPLLGHSNCQTKIFVNITTPKNCSYEWSDGSVRGFTCPFHDLSSKPGIMWSCGTKAFHTLPSKFQWSGCCHPSVVTTGITILYEHPHVRIVREISGPPSNYKGYVLTDPWTSPSANIGWSVFLGGGTTAALNKINGLAWSVLQLANETESGLSLINMEMTAIRTAVIQHRLALDILLAEKGGMCKLINASCCFHIPDERDNITNIIKHMQDAIQDPPTAGNSWFSWIESWGQEWLSWTLTTVAPVLTIFFLFCIFAPCLLKCALNILMKKRTSSPTFLQADVEGCDANKMYQTIQKTPTPPEIIDHSMDSDSDLDDLFL